MKRQHRQGIADATGTSFDPRYLANAATANPGPADITVGSARQTPIYH